MMPLASPRASMKDTILRREIRARQRPVAFVLLYLWELAWSLLIAAPIHAWARRSWGAHPDGDGVLFRPGARELATWIGGADEAAAVVVRMTILLLVVGAIIGQVPLGALVASLIRRLRASQAKWHMACDWVEKGSVILRAITSDERADSATHRAAQAIGRAQSQLLNMQGMFSRALNQIARGSNVIFQVAGGCGLGAIQAAKDNKDWGIGVDADQFYLGKQVLTSALKKVDVGVYDTIKLAGSKKWKGGVDGLYNAKNGGVGYGKVSAAAPKRAALIAKLNAWTKQLASGKVKPPTTVK